MTANRGRHVGVHSSPTPDCQWRHNLSRASTSGTGGNQHGCVVIGGEGGKRDMDGAGCADGWRMAWMSVGKHHSGGCSAGGCVDGDD
eukprot:573387-Prorocentrum_lima.AAC.1